MAGYVDVNNLLHCGDWIVQDCNVTELYYQIMSLFS